MALKNIYILFLFFQIYLQKDYWSIGVFCPDLCHSNPDLNFRRIFYSASNFYSNPFFLFFFFLYLFSTQKNHSPPNMKLLLSIMKIVFCVASVSFLPVANSFIWPLNSEVSYEYPIRITEGHMFASHNGPPLLVNGESFIETDAIITTYSRYNHSTKIYVLFYGTDEEHDIEDVPGICESNVRKVNWINNVSSFSLFSVYSFPLI